MPVTTHSQMRINTHRPDAEEAIRAKVRKEKPLPRVRDKDNLVDSEPMSDGYTPHELSADAFRKMLVGAPKPQVDGDKAQVAIAAHKNVGATHVGDAPITLPNTKAAYAAVAQFVD